MPTLTCSLEGCDKTFHRKPSEIKRTKTRLFFCCKDHRIQVGIAGYAKYPSTNITICDYCSTVVPHNRASTDGPKYCSKECFYESQRSSLEHKRKMMRKESQRKRDNLTGVYVRKRIKTHTGLDPKDIPEDLVKLKRVILQAHRQYN